MNRRTSASPIALRGPNRLAFVAMLSTLMGVGWACKPTFMNSAALTASVSTSPTPSPSASASTTSTAVAAAANIITPPTVTGVNPNTGSSGGGILITITGTGFKTGASVTTGGLPCTSVSVLSSTQISCRTSPGASGTVASIAVTNTDTGSASLPSALTYTAGWGILGHLAFAAGWITGGGFSSTNADGTLPNSSGGALDGAGHILIIDTANGRVSKYNASTGAFVGAIGNSTAAGSCAAGAQTGWCVGGTFSSASADGAFTGLAKLIVQGSYFYASDNGRVQRFNLSTGAFAGTIGSSTVNAGTCIIGKQNGWCTGGTFTTGLGDGIFSNTSGLATDASWLYVADDAKIQKFNLSTGAFIGAIGVSTAAGTCVAGKQTNWCTGGNFSTSPLDGGFDFPKGLALSGNLLYVADYNNHRVQKFNLTTTAVFEGAIGNSTAAGSCSAGAQSNWCTGGTFSSGTSDGRFNYPLDVVAHASNLYVVEHMGYRIQKMNLSTGAFEGAVGHSTAAGSCVAGAQPGWCVGGSFSSNSADGKFGAGLGFIYDPSGSALYVGGSNPKLQKFDRATGAFIAALGAVNQINSVNTIQSSWAPPSGVVVAGTAGASDGAFNNPRGVAIDPAGQYAYVLDSNRLQRFNLATGAFAGMTGRSTTANATCTIGSQTQWCTGGTAAAGGLLGQLQGGTGVAVDPSGTYILTADTDHRVQRFIASSGTVSSAVGRSTSASGTCLMGAQTGWCNGSAWGGAGFTDGQFINPFGLAIDGAGFFYVGDASHVQKFNLATGAHVGSIGYSASAGTNCTALAAQTGWCTGGNFNMGSTGADGMFNAAWSLAIAGSYLYVGDGANNRVQRFNLSTGAFAGAIGNSTASGTCAAGKQTSWCTGGNFSSGAGDGMFNYVQGLAAGGGYLYVSDAFNHRVQKFNLSTGAFVGAVGASTAAGTCVAGAQTSFCTNGVFGSGRAIGMFNDPYGLALDPNGSYLLVNEQAGARVQRLAPP